MKIIIDHTKKLASLKKEFNRFFPFLTLEFSLNKQAIKISDLDNIIIGKYRKSTETEVLRISPNMSISDLEGILKRHLGITVYVLRKSGTVWLKTTHTDKWSLEQQNAQGEAVSLDLNKYHKNQRAK